MLQLLQGRPRLLRLELLHRSLLRRHLLPFHAGRGGRQVAGRPLLHRPLLEERPRRPLLKVLLHWLLLRVFLLLLLRRRLILLLPRLHGLKLLLHLLLPCRHAETRYRQHHAKLRAVGTGDLHQLQRRTRRHAVLDLHSQFLRQAKHMGVRHA